VSLNLRIPNRRPKRNKLPYYPLFLFDIPPIYLPPDIPPTPLLDITSLLLLNIPPLPLFDNPYLRHITTSKLATMARPTQDNDNNNDWKNSLPPGVDQYARVIDETWDSFEFDINNHTTKQMNGYLLYRIIFYQSKNYIDTKLWECFKEDFDEWTLEIWSKGNRDIVE
jgi:hypothetical protein